MANEYKLQDMIDQYLMGTLEGEALDIFKKKLRDDAEFAKTVELQKMLVEEIQATRKAELKEYLQENAEVQYIQNIWGTKWMYASAAIIAVTIGLYFAIQRLEQTPQMTKSDDTEEVIEDQSIASEDANELPAHDAVDSTIVVENNEVDSNMIADVTRPEIGQEAVEEDAETTTLDELGQEEKELASDDKEVVEKDSLISKGFYEISPIYAFVRPDEAETEDDVDYKSVDSIQVTTQESTRKRFKLRDKAEAKSKDAPDTTVAANKVDTEEVGLGNTFERIEIQFWKSVVGYEGYRLSEGVLRLYGVTDSQSIVLKNYANSLYISIDGTYFVLENNNRFNKYKKVTDQNVLEVLK